MPPRIANFAGRMHEVFQSSMHMSDTRSSSTTMYYSTVDRMRWRHHSPRTSLTWTCCAKSTDSFALRLTTTTVFGRNEWLNNITTSYLKSIVLATSPGTKKERYVTRLKWHRKTLLMPSRRLAYDGERKKRSLKAKASSFVAIKRVTSALDWRATK